MAKKNYTAEDIQVLDDRSHCRLRTQMYLGNLQPTTFKVPVFLNDSFEIKEFTFIPAVFKAVGEIFDNSIDEFSQTKKANKTLKIVAEPEEGKFSISDTGRGIPIDPHPTIKGKYTPEVALTNFRAGRNFKSEKEIGVIGQNGIGAAACVFCSSDFKVTIHRDGKRYTQQFENGAETIHKPKIAPVKSADTGTDVSFTLDSTVFNNISLPNDLIHNRALEIAFNNPGVCVSYNGNKYKYKNGFKELVKNISSDHFCFSSDTMDIYVVFDKVESTDEQMFTWVNSSLLFDGGLCNTQFLNAFYDKVTDQLAGAAKKEKSEVTKNDIRQNLLILASLKVANPEYDAQSKTRLTGPNLRKELLELIDANWSAFVRKSKPWLETVLSRAVERHHYDANKKALKDHQKSLKKRVAKLTDATSTNRSNCQLLITEGDSAASSITEVRDPKTTAILPLMGKINNVYGMTIAQLLQMGKITDLLSVIGLVPGKKVVRSELRYGKIIIATDSDNDGDDIMSLLVNLFYQFWPDLFDPAYPPMVFRLIAPNVVVSKGQKRVHFSSRQQYEKEKNKYKGWGVEYMKGLGSLTIEDWEMVLLNGTGEVLPFTHDTQMPSTLTLLFGPDSGPRKEWLQVDNS